MSISIVITLMCYYLVCVVGKTLTNTSRTPDGINNVKSINSTCASSFECAGKLLCYSGICKCSNDMFWNGTNCLMRKSHQVLCNESQECQETLYCDDDACQCEDIDYWNGFKCILRKTVNDACGNSEECGNMLYCARQFCQCASSDFWTGTTCALRKSVNVSCSSSVECSDGLQCSDGKCQCCKSDYWNGTGCRKKKLTNSICSSVEECLDGLQCNNNICKCPSDTYWNENRCVNKKNYNEACNTDSECHQTLHCLDGQCKCNNEEFWTHSTCTQKKELDTPCTSSHECQSNLECTDYRCSCRQQFYWDGLNCSRNRPKECADILSDKDGVYTVYPFKKISVYCIMRGTKKWTVIQRRINGSVDFYRTWRDYKIGFGTVYGEYWLGNDNIHHISTHGHHELSIYMEIASGEHRTANYSTFAVGDEDSKYILTVTGYSGNAGADSMDQVDSAVKANGMPFSTKDRDNDNSSGNCAVSCKSAWWFNNCYWSDFNRAYNGQTGRMYWAKWSASISKSTIMIRRKS